MYFRKMPLGVWDMKSVFKKKNEISDNIIYVTHMFNFGVWRNRHLSLFLGGIIHFFFLGKKTTDVVWVGWGRKKSGLRAVTSALKRGSNYLLVEDGFLRSVGPGYRDTPISVLKDSQGIYYDAGAPSDLEWLIAKKLTDKQVARVQELIASWRDARVSKYNYLPERSMCLPGRYVLVVDQTFNDASIKYGMASAISFSKMLDSALEQYQECKVIVKIHPDVFAGKKKGHYDINQLKKNPRIKVVAEDIHPVSLLEHAEAVFTVTSQLGFEALIWGKKVHTYGMPFYAGYGLTVDAIKGSRVRPLATLEQLVHASLIGYPKYIHPETALSCSPEEAVAWMGLQRKMLTRFDSPIFAIGFSVWKRPIVRSFFQERDVTFIKNLDQFPKVGFLVVWGLMDTGSVEPERVVRLEDGFLRSVGLGADLVRPISWVMDSRGMYYDATRPSDLEYILQNRTFSPSLIERAKILRERIVTGKLTKYNVGIGKWSRPEGVARVILVPGQVETDASIRFGSPVIKSNIKLLRMVREQNPDAYIVYKPHPDVVAGLRDQSDRDSDMETWCDEIVVEYAIGELFQQVDEVHVMTSLAGFEALLRGKRVVTFGQPFYAGWGLTDDQYPLSRRSRTLSLEELVAGALILYPAYVSYRSGGYTTPENALEELLLWQKNGVSKMPYWRRVIRPLLVVISKLRGKR